MIEAKVAVAARAQDRASPRKAKAMPQRLFRKPRFTSYLADPLAPRRHRGAILPEEAGDAGGLRDRLSALGGILLLAGLVAALALLARWLLAP